MSTSMLFLLTVVMCGVSGTWFQKDEIMATLNNCDVRSRCRAGEKSLRLSVIRFTRTSICCRKAANDPSGNKRHTMPIKQHTMPYNPNNARRHTWQSKQHTMPHNPNNARRHTWQSKQHTMPYNNQNNARQHTMPIKQHTMPHNPNNARRHTMPYNPKLHTMPHAGRRHTMPANVNTPPPSIFRRHTPSG